MMSRKTAIVLTTIFEPKFLPGFLENLRAYGREATSRIIIIPDRKTPPTVEAAAAAARRVGFRVDCPTLEEQEAFLQRVGAPADFIPYNTDNRRNVGFLMALADGCDVLISIDDDNFILPAGDPRATGDFVGQHDVVGRPGDAPPVTSSDGWFNICSLLDGWGSPPVFPRGFPYYAQRAERRVELGAPADVGRGAGAPAAAMNAGLWLDEPDVDAVFRLCRGPKGTKYPGQAVLLGPDVWSPINTQNTGLTREAALTYYYVRMGFPLKGLSIDRFGDILSGYLTQKVVKHFGQGVRVGGPVLDHRRTVHNLFKDLYHELAGIVLIEEFLPWLIAERLEGATALEAYASLAQRMHAAADRFTGFIWDDGGRDFLRQTARCMETWIRVVSPWA